MAVPESRPIQTVLIANRGEIARRIIRTCRRLGLRVVALHTDTDRAALHAREADVAVAVGSYLDIDEVVAAAVAAGADAVHPGYGFLSERAEFAAALDAAGITLVGPSAAVMEQMGRKDRARAIAVAAGVPVVPSYEVADDPASFAYPVLVKAAAGGGGKGMRVVRTQAEYADAVAAARREAAAAFGDDTLLVEKYVESGRHIEVQVLGDTHGTVVHLFERDCSTQRRHQKVLEEAPAPTISEQVRESVTAAAVALAREVGYTGAGTVEFLFDNASDQAYFLEMNTRLQVEHPVTELAVSVAGRSPDLVELQLRVAAGEPLPFTQADVAITGHAIEARVYAEDPWAGFLPQAGTASYVRWPAGEGGGSAGGPADDGGAAGSVRVDHALVSGSVVSTSYDPMLGKVIAAGADREQARRRLVAALDETAVLGLTTNAGFLRALVASPEFRDAAIDTAWLDHSEPARPDQAIPLVLAAWAEAAHHTRDAGAGPVGADPFAADGWRLAGDPAPIRVELEGDPLVRLTGPGVGEVHGFGVREVERSRLGPGETWHLQLELSGPELKPEDGTRHSAYVSSARHQVEVAHRGQRWVFERPDVFGDHVAAAGDGTLVAPMPGTVREVRVAVGQQVSEGEVLGIMEAMKMELALRAHFDGQVSEVAAVVGAQVALGAILFQVDPARPAPELAAPPAPADVITEEPHDQRS